jgi:hypothetical protein
VAASSNSYILGNRTYRGPFWNTIEGKKLAAINAAIFTYRSFVQAQYTNDRTDSIADGGAAGTVSEGLLKGVGGQVNSYTTVNRNRGLQERSIAQANLALMGIGVFDPLTVTSVFGARGSELNPSLGTLYKDLFTQGLARLGIPSKYY